MCAICRGSLPPGRRRYCSTECYNISARSKGHETRTRDSAGDVSFVGVDGEGVTDSDGDHRYVLLSIGDRSLTASDTGGALWGVRLQWWEIFKFLHDYQVKFPSAVMVGFFLGYDTAQWFRTLPEHSARELLTTKGMQGRHRTGEGVAPLTVKLADHEGVTWEFDWLPGRRFKVRPRGHKTWAYVMDTGAFWQSSFLTAIDPKSWPIPVVTSAEYDILEAGKEARATAQLDDAMVEYNVLENDVLARIMGKLDEAFVRLGIRLKRTQWFGPGQASQNWLGQQAGVPTATALADLVSDWALITAGRTYYGGWFDRQVHGVVKRLWEYDINSAYPFCASRLPCLLHGKWSRGTGEVPSGGFTMVRVTAESEDPAIGCGLQWRGRTGNIMTPGKVAGWYWLSEVKAAQQACYYPMAYVVHEWIHYAPCDCDPPMADIARLYDLRYEIGKNSPEGKAIKLLLNSIYGKFAQTVGGPKFCNPIYASLITSGCRTMILNAIGTHPGKSMAVGMVATDGVYFLEPHPSLPLSATTLGLWDETVKDNTCLFLPGMYWDDKARTALRNNESVAFKARGVNAKFLAPHIERIDEQFRSFDETVQEWPSIKIPIPFAMVTPLQALQRKKWHLAGTITTGGTRTLTSDPAPKRLNVGTWTSLPNGSDTILRTVVPPGVDEESHAYTKFNAHFGEDPVDVDGLPLQAMFADWMHGE